MTFWTYVWGIVLGVIIGGIVTGSAMLLVEWWKNRNISKNWKKSLLIEVKQNYILKRNEVKDLKNRLTGIPEGLDIFDLYANAFDIFYSFLKAGQALKNMQIIYKYSEYITKETQHKIIRRAWFENNFKPSIKRKGKLVSTSAPIPNLDIILEKDKEQLKSIKEILNLLLKETKTKIKEEG